MARTKDRHIISEAVRVSDVWTILDNFPDSVVLKTDCDEQLEVIYGKAGQVRFAEYIHWDRDTLEVVSREQIKLHKRDRVLQLLGALK